MFKQALNYVMALSFFGLAAFTDTKNEDKWTAILNLDGIQKSYTLTSDAIYGGYNPIGKKYFFYGKNHMFNNKDNENISKIFNDLCITNASGKFEFELNSVPKAVPTSKTVTYAGNLSFKRKSPIQGTFTSNSSAGEIQNEISVSGDLKNLGFQMTEEAGKVITGKFTLKFIAKK